MKSDCSGEPRYPISKVDIEEVVLAELVEAAEAVNRLYIEDALKADYGFAIQTGHAFVRLRAAIEEARRG